MKKYYLWKFDGVHLNNLYEVAQLIPILDKEGYPVLDEAGNPMMELDPRFVEVECESTDDIVTNFIWYKVDDTGKIIKMDDDEFYTVHPNYGKYIPTETELLGQMVTDAELERMEIGQRMTDLELMVLEGGM